MIRTLDDVFDAYLTELRNPNAERKRKSADSIEAHFKSLRILWGDWTVEAFKPGAKPRVKAQCDKWREEGMAANTMRKRLSQMLTAYRYCIEEELLAAELFPIIRLPRAGPPRERVLTAEELSSLLWWAYQDCTEPHVCLRTVLQLGTGQRPSAITDLTWDLVDFEKRVIRFRDTEAAGERSKKRRTDVPMGNTLFALLSEAKAKAKTPFVMERRGRRAKSQYAGLRALFARAGIKDLQPRDFRRTAGTIAFHELGGDLKAAANLLGDSVEVADEVYVQRHASSLVGPVDAIDAAMERARKSA